MQQFSRTFGGWFISKRYSRYADVGTRTIGIPQRVRYRQANYCLKVQVNYRNVQKWCGNQRHYPGTDAFSVIVIESTCSLLPLGTYLFSVSTLNRYLSCSSNVIFFLVFLFF